jgi:hypothetical protein
MLDADRDGNGSVLLTGRALVIGGGHLIYRDKPDG